MRQSPPQRCRFVWLMGRALQVKPLLQCSDLCVTWYAIFAFLEKPAEVLSPLQAQQQLSQLRNKWHVWLMQAPSTIRTQLGMYAGGYACS